jgi:EmrB/QacA subfamily drug resistance transporter
MPDSAAQQRPLGDRTSRPRRAGLVLAALCAADFLVVLDGLIVAVALPTMQQALGMSPTSLQWVVTAYILCFGGFLLLGGRLTDTCGRRRILLVGLLLFAGGALLAGLAWGAVVLIAGRAVQGLGAALMAPAALALLVASFPEPGARARVLGWWSAAGSLGIPAGALLGGVITASLGWRWVLLANVPVALLAAIGTRWVVPESRDTTSPRRLDFPGAVLVTTGLALVIYALVQVERLAAGSAGPELVLLPLGLAMALLAGFVARQHRTPAPLVPLRALRARGLVAANLTGAALPAGLGALLFIATLYLQTVLDFTPLTTGLAYLAVALPVVAASPAASWLVPRLGVRAVAVLGFALQAAGLLLLVRVPTDGSFATDVLPAFVLVGLGAPIAFVPTTSAALAGDSHTSGLAAGIFNTSQQIGNALTLAAMATTAATWTTTLLARGLDDASALTGGYRAAFALAAATAITGALTALRLPDAGTRGRPNEDRQQERKALFSWAR